MITRKRSGESIANSLGTDVYYRYSHGSVPERISTEKVNSRSLGSIIEIRLIFLMIFHERRKDFPFFYSSRARLSSDLSWRAVR